MEAPETIKLYQQYVLGTYSPKLLMVKGQGAELWDAAGRRYLDFTAGISVCNLGHCHPRVTEALQRQAARLVHVSNLYLNELAPQLAAAIIRHSFDGRVFFCNSGAEANEGLIKFARRWGNARGGRHRIVCMNHSFHGRTLATLAATDKPAIQQGFQPLPEGFAFVPFNDLAALDQAIDDQTCAVLLEPVQGEGGIHPAQAEYLAGVQELCAKHDLLLLFDEVQCGMGRTGKCFAHQHYGIEPDGMSLAKALGNGFPLGAMVLARKHEAVLGPSSHATTFGGTALACAAGLAVFEAFDQEDILFNVQKVGQHLQGALLRLAAKHPSVVKEVRGLGLMWGLECHQPVAPRVAACGAQGLLVLSAGDYVLRLLPPLIITPAQADEAVAILDHALGEKTP